MCKFLQIFRPVNESEARYRVLLGSAGSGKSVNVAQDYILKLSMPEYAGCNLVVVRSVEVSHNNSTFAELIAAINRLGLLNIWKIRSSPLSLKCLSTGNEVIFRGCSDARARERLKSVATPAGKITWIWIEEATELHYSDFTILNDRLRGILPDNHYYQITLTFNPININHWIKTKLWDTVDSNILKHKSTYLDNVFIDAGYKEMMMLRKEHDPEGYQVYGLGNWGEVGGLVFNNFRVCDLGDTIFDYYTIGADWGFSHASVFLLVGWKDEIPHIIQEVYATQKTTSELLRLAQSQDFDFSLATCYCDSAEPDRILELKRNRISAIAVQKERNSVANQISWLKQRPILVDGRCVHLIKELQQFKYERDPNTGMYTDKPIGVNDDAIAALRYASEPIRKARRIGSMPKGVLQ